MKLHPEHKDVPYALYQLGLAHFNQIRGVDRDQTPAEKALGHFQMLIDNYPESEFSGDVVEKINFCKESVAAHEYYVAAFYFKRGNYTGAAERFKLSLERFPGFGPKEDAMFYLGKSLLALDDKKKGIETLTRLISAFPESRQAAEATELIKNAREK